MGILEKKKKTENQEGMAREGTTDTDMSMEEHLFSMEQRLNEQAEDHRKVIEKLLYMTVSL